MDRASARRVPLAATRAREYVALAALTVYLLYNVTIMSYEEEDACDAIQRPQPPVS
jgi:hypothetical protein